MLPKVNAIKEGEDTKFIITLGEFSVNNEKFETQEDAERYIAENYNFTKLEEQVICATMLKIIEINNQLKNKEK